MSDYKPMTLAEHEQITLAAEAKQAIVGAATEMVDWLFYEESMRGKLSPTQINDRLSVLLSTLVMCVNASRQP